MSPDSQFPIPLCVPLCNAGNEASWYKHEALCPRRTWRPSPMSIHEAKQRIVEVLRAVKADGIEVEPHWEGYVFVLLRRGNDGDEVTTFDLQEPNVTPNRVP